ncbi:hypothetical protein QT970_24545 [Microcoleus sp. herbarium8]|uniref:hypothetical protein n=1 Tax=Microcoleus sp. herbarium8 TaxID=3055436 RepID=UPI002FD3CCFA
MIFLRINNTWYVIGRRKKEEGRRKKEEEIHSKPLGISYFTFDEMNSFTPSLFNVKRDRPRI